jgi:4-hydroxy 2-oxovalerate aldolase
MSLDIRNIKLLDCTLRDGGYVNDNTFGKENIEMIIKGLANSGIDLIEYGYLEDRNLISEDKVEYRRFEDLNNIAVPKKSKILMLLGEKYDIKNLPQAFGDCVLRISFHKKGAESGLKKVEEAIRKGYRVFVQPTATMFYSNDELEELLKKCNLLKPESVAIVDTFGQMKPEDVEEKVSVFDRVLDKDIAISFHAHNNLQNAYANAIRFMESVDAGRVIIIDSSIYGMGRGAGNLPTELIMNYLNEVYGKDYNIDSLLSVVDDVIMKMKSRHDWGYSLPYYLSGVYGIHPSYILSFMERKTQSSSDIRGLISIMSDDRKSEFDLDYANELYNSYNNRNVNDDEERKKLANTIGDRPVLLVGPGKSIHKYRQVILDYIEKKSPYVISVNGYYEMQSNAVFFSNKKRYANMKNVIEDCMLLVTSNIDIHDEECLIFNYSSYLAKENGVSDNALLMMLNILKKIGVKNVVIVGFDGYSMEDNFYKGSLELLLNRKYVDKLNRDIMINIECLKRDMDVVSLTPSKYLKEEEK